MPHVIHLLSFPSPGEAFTPQLRSVLIHYQPVLHAQWNPIRKGNLAATCGGPALYTWSDEWVDEEVGEVSEEEVAECVGIPASE